MLVCLFYAVKLALVLVVWVVVSLLAFLGVSLVLAIAWGWCSILLVFTG